MITEINVTPLVDIMLVLLIIFMVTASYIVRDSIDVKLPEAATGEKQKVSILAVTIDADGKLRLNGKAADENAIRRFIREESKRSKKKMEAVIAADKRVSHGQVVRVIDLVRAEGIYKFAINVLKPDK
ncbi:MAG: biopolymer transporter ExbD [Myxococcales bacterium]|nr:biopolymer transporter ExbD [Myxococcales bacterium]